MGPAEPPRGLVFPERSRPLLAAQRADAHVYTTLHDGNPAGHPARIDYPKVTRMAKWMYLIEWFVAKAPNRPAVAPGCQLER